MARPNNITVYLRPEVAVAIRVLEERWGTASRQEAIVRAVLEAVENVQ